MGERAVNRLRTETERRPLIGVMPKFVASNRIPKTVSSCDSLVMANNYLQAVMTAGGIPVVIPITEDSGVYATLFAQLDGFLLTGGADINPARYGGNTAHEKLGFVIPEREEVEFRVIEYALEHDAPLLGICRGIQLLNVYFGGTLYEDLPEQLAGDEAGEGFSEEPIVHWQSCAYDQPSHAVKVVEGSRLRGILGVGEIATNSMHHQGIRRLADELEPMAYGPGGLVESAEVRDRSFMVGLQWHPEYLTASDAAMRSIFSEFVEQAARYQARKASRA